MFPAMRTSLRKPILGLSCLLLPLFALGCSDEAVNPTPTSPDSYDVTIRRDAFGVPHVKADDMASAGFGLGYAGAQDYVCILADQVLMANSKRAATFGAGVQDANIKSDFLYGGLDVRANGQALLDDMSEEFRGVVEGFVAGYNHYVEETAPEALPGYCQGQSWVQPISMLDWAAYASVLNLRASALPFSTFVLGAKPPAQADYQPPPDSSAENIPLPNFKDLPLGSNAWGIGAEMSESGGGMLIGNPHFPWVGELKFYESHIHVDGVVNVYGASLIGLPIVNIGFTEGVAWSHTVTPSNHFTVYSLDLVPGDPTKYMYDGEERELTSSEVTIDVLGDDGTLSQQSRTFWRSHYGPMVAGPQVEWSDTRAYSFRDANADNTQVANVWAEMNRAQSVDDLYSAMQEHHGIPWVYTVAADKGGESLVIDASRVPKLNASTEAGYLDALQNDGTTQGFAALGVVLLPGGSSDTEWDGINAGGDGLVPVTEAPQLRRDDFVVNANEDLWMANPADPIESFSITYGVPANPMTPRTRTNLRIVTDGQAAGDDGKFSFEELRTAALNNRASTAENLRPEVASRCDQVTDVDVNGTMVDISEACVALIGWDGLLNLDSVGAIVWREFIANFNLVDAEDLYAVGFDAGQPLTTPNSLVAAPVMGPDPILVAIGQAVLNLAEAGLSPSDSLGDAQYTMRGDLRIPIHGGSGSEGATNVVGFSESNSSSLVPRFDPGEELNGRTGLYDSGYPVNNGSSFIIAVEFGASGPQASALLTYSESSDPASPHHSDQTQAYSDKAWRTVLFTEEAINADPELVVTELSVPRASP
jgi:acyl-homoserine-lactone acylase